MSGQKYLAVGVVAGLLTVVINPVLAAAGVLNFVLGGLLAVAAPLFFGVIALGAGIQLYRHYDQRQGVGVTVTSVIVVLVGIALGFGAVF